jgi:hypothetical protein
MIQQILTIIQQRRNFYNYSATPQGIGSAGQVITAHPGGEPWPFQTFSR